MNVLPENVEYEGLNIIPEENFRETMAEKVEPYLASCATDGVIYSKNDGHRIYYKNYDNGGDKGTVVILHGFSEFITKYNEPVFYFLDQGYKVYMIEHFGHGYSERDVENLYKISVSDFSVYVEDVNQLVNEVVIPADGKDNLFLFAHSMGGGIGTRYLETYPDTFKAAILTSPMIEINLGWPPEWLARFLAGSAKFFGAGDNYVISHGGFEGIDEFNDPACPASSHERYLYGFEKRLENEYWQTYGATYDWLDASLKATKLMVKEEEAEKVTIPVLLFQAENDSLVKSKGQLEFATYAKNVNIVFCPDSKHEIFNSPDDVIKPYWATVFQFLDSVN